MPIRAASRLRERERACSRNGGGEGFGFWRVVWGMLGSWLAERMGRWGEFLWERILRWFWWNFESLKWVAMRLEDSWTKKSLGKRYFYFIHLVTNLDWIFWKIIDCIIHETFWNRWGIVESSFCKPFILTKTAWYTKSAVFCETWELWIILCIRIAMCSNSSKFLHKQIYLTSLMPRLPQIFIKYVTIWLAINFFFFKKKGRMII